jgi:hypothetical protein
VKKKPDKREEGAFAAVNELREHLQKNLKRKALWSKAAEYHLKLPPDSIAELAIQYANWSDLERNRPEWRDLLRGYEQNTPEAIRVYIESRFAEGLSWLDVRDDLRLQGHLKQTAVFDQQLSKALREFDSRFLSKLAKASQMVEEGRASIDTTAGGLVLLAWRELGGLTLFHKSPTRQMIEQWVKKRHKSGFSVRTWQRTWANRRIKALLLS